jgi:hypothetical protein
MDSDEFRDLCLAPNTVRQVAVDVIAIRVVTQRAS